MGQVVFKVNVEHWSDTDCMVVAKVAQGHFDFWGDTLSNILTSRFFRITVAAKINFAG